MYNVKVELVPDNADYRQRLIIVDNAGEREHWDGGEPEDNKLSSVTASEKLATLES